MIVTLTIVKISLEYLMSFVLSNGGILTSIPPVIKISKMYVFLYDF